MLDGVIVAGSPRSISVKNVVRLFKKNGIENIALLGSPFGNSQLIWLEQEKVFIPYLEVNLIDACNLNCKGCTHFANLFTHDKSVYSIENFRRDVKKISELADVLEFRLLGGEPLLIKNLDEYIAISRHFLPKTRLELVTNGLLIPKLSQKILDSIKMNNIIICISGYKPTLQNIDKIKSVLESNCILYYTNGVVKEFLVFMTLNGRHDPTKSRLACPNDICRFLRDGRIYKCPIDALSFKVAEKFNLENLPAPTFADLYAQNFSSMYDGLDGNVECVIGVVSNPEKFLGNNRIILNSKTGFLIHQKRMLCWGNEELELRIEELSFENCKNFVAHVLRTMFMLSCKKIARGKF